MWHFKASCFVVVLFIIRSGYGLQCYNCIHLETILPSGLTGTLPSDATCKSGDSQSENIIVECEHQVSITEGGSNSNNAAINEDENRNGTTFSCAIFVFNGTFNQHYNGLPFGSTIRTCISRRHSSVPFQELCNNGTLEDVILKREDFELPSFLKTYVDALDHNNTFTVACTCNDGSCNGLPSSQFRRYKASYKASSKRSWDEDRVVVFFIVFAILLVLAAIVSGCYFICKR